MKKAFVAVVVLGLLLGCYLWIVNSSEAQRFRCSVCGSTSHGSLWHDSDKDGVNDR